MLQHKTQLSLPSAGLSGFEPPMSAEESAIQGSVHRFAKEVLRPLGAELDRLSAEEVIAPGSPLYGAFAGFAQLGIDPSLLAEMPAEMAVRIESLIGEELGWGDAGLAVSLGAAGFAAQVAASIGDQELIDLAANRISCWIATQPDRGSDVTMMHHGNEWPAGKPGSRGNLLAKVGADEVVINGQSSAWVSNGPIAQVAVAYMTADYGDGFVDADGRTNGIAMLLPLDLPGVSRGKPLDKIGQRSLPQGEIYFDNVKVPRRFAIGERDGYYGSFASVWSYGGTHMAQVFTGVARAAFELALKYCHERKQGGA
ncbi:MAG TPA: acyl-CoA dehydrogenase family protein, partial [Solimonas sp.]|nr:acyl-CoA dehydrogenase family protein [Solimonas sp.]